MTSPSHPHAAAVLIVTAMALMGLVDNFVATIAETAGLWQFQVLRSGMALGALMLLAGVFGWRLRPRRWRPVIARSAILSVALMIYFASLALMPIAQAVSGLFTAPIFVLILSVLAFEQRVGPVRIAAAVLGFAGVLMVLRPEGGAGWLALLPLVSGMFYALAQIATRAWCAEESALTLLGGFFVAMGLWGLAGLAVLTLFPQPVPDGAAGFALRLWGDMSPAAWVWTVAQALASLFAVGLIIRAYQIGEASFVAVYEYALLVFAVFWGWLLLGHEVDGWTLGGIAAILGSGVAITLRSGTAAPVEVAGPGDRRRPASRP